MFVLNNGGAIACATVPDVCLTLADALPVPVPYPNVSTSDLADPAVIVENVLVVAMPALNMASTLVLSDGDQEGTVGGILSGEIMGEVGFLTASVAVMIGGLPAVYLSCTTTHNMNNTIGLVVSPSQTVVMALC